MEFAGLEMLPALPAGLVVEEEQLTSGDSSAVPSPGLPLSPQVCVDKWDLINASRLHLPRPSAVALEMQRLNALDLEKKIGKSILGKVLETPANRFLPQAGWGPRVRLWPPQTTGPTPSSVWQVHLAMVRYHEGGRFCQRDEDWDRTSAIFHLEHAADLGELEAIVGLGLMYSQLPHRILADVSVMVRGGPAGAFCGHGDVPSRSVGPGASL